RTRDRARGSGEHRLCFVEPALFEQGPTEHEPGIADLVEHVLALADDLERVARLLLRALHVTGAQVNLCERVDGSRRVLAAIDLERDRVRLLEALDRLLRAAE